MKVKYEKEVDLNDLTSTECMKLLEEFWGYGYVFNYHTEYDPSTLKDIVAISQIHNAKISFVDQSSELSSNDVGTAEQVRRMTHALAIEKLNKPKSSKKPKKEKK